MRRLDSPLVESAIELRRYEGFARLQAAIVVTANYKLVP